MATIYIRQLEEKPTLLLTDITVIADLNSDRGYYTTLTKLSDLILTGYLPANLGDTSVTKINIGTTSVKASISTLGVISCDSLTLNNSSARITAIGGMVCETLVAVASGSAGYITTDTMNAAAANVSGLTTTSCLTIKTGTTIYGSISSAGVITGASVVSTNGPVVAQTSLEGASLIISGALAIDSSRGVKATSLSIGTGAYGISADGILIVENMYNSSETLTFTGTSGIIATVGDINIPAGALNAKNLYIKTSPAGTPNISLTSATGKIDARELYVHGVAFAHSLQTSGSLICTDICIEHGDITRLANIELSDSAGCDIVGGTDRSITISGVSSTVGTKKDAIVIDPESTVTLAKQLSVRMVKDVNQMIPAVTEYTVITYAQPGTKTNTYAYPTEYSGYPPVSGTWVNVTKPGVYLVNMQITWSINRNPHKYNFIAIQDNTGAILAESVDRGDTLLTSGPFFQTLTTIVRTQPASPYRTVRGVAKHTYNNAEYIVATASQSTDQISFFEVHKIA